MYNIEPTILTSLIGGLGVLITLMVLATGYRSNYSYEYQQRKQSVRERYITLMDADLHNVDWIDPDFADDEDLELFLQMIGK